ncbi:MAG: DUF2865 domain-containing protein [Rhizobiaceae bacterium]
MKLGIVKKYSAARYTSEVKSQTAMPLLVALIAAFWLQLHDVRAQSNSEICRGLNARLASLSLSGNSGNSKKYRQYENAIRKQKLQIGKARRAARRNGCVGLFKKRNSQCRRINDSLRKMEVNLTQLKRTKAQLSPNQGRVSRERQLVLRDMEKNGCYGDGQTQITEAAPEKKSRRRTLLEQIFGVRTYSDRGLGRYGEDIVGDEGIFSRYGTYRTLCVRKTDGYYFPISFSTIPERFGHDEELCQNMCPSSDVGLYVHRMPNQDSEDMISYRTEIPYAQEPFAFAYRKSHNPEFRCRFSVAGISQSVDAEATGEVEKPKTETIRIGVPNFRKDPAQNPDAYDNQMARLTLKQARDYLIEANSPNAAIAEREFSDGKKIRIVGPAFFPVQ